MEKVNPLPIRGREGAPPKPRRVYKASSVGEAEGGFWQVLLDGKPAMSPLRKPLATRARLLAEAVAAEWQAQDPVIDPEAMPLTRLLATEIDGVATQREAVIASLLGYVDADSLCYWAPHPAALRDRQRRSWQPVLDWLAREHDIVLKPREGAMPVAQAPEVAARMRRILEGMSDSDLTAFQAVAGLAHSLALAFALVGCRLSADEAFAAAFLDELHQAEEWGDDAEAVRRRARLAEDIGAIARYINLAGAGVDPVTPRPGSR
jgi:chaperone required for assembly of F1-ATPase